MITPEQQAKMQAAAAAKRAVEKEEAEAKFVTKEEFKNLSDNVSELVNLLKNKPKDEELNTKEVNEAKPNQSPVSPIWEDTAKEILGNFLDHCEVFYPKEGGTYFTVVIKRELSNADKNYMLDLRNQDRRTREVSRTGLEGVKSWCLLIKQNLNKNK